MSACPAVVKRTSPVYAREMLNENGAAVYVNRIFAESADALGSTGGRGKTDSGTS
jgi:hypothetical protein